MIRTPSWRIAAAAIIATLAAAKVSAEELRVFSATTMRLAMEDIALGFQSSTEHTLAFRFANASDLRTQILTSPMSFDAAILPAELTAELIHTGRLAGGGVTNIAKSGLGVAIRAGASRPDLSSESRFWKSLVSARSIAYDQDGSIGAYFAKLLSDRGADRYPVRALGITGRSPLELVATGEAELAIGVVSEIKGAPGVELAAPFPDALQRYITLSASVSTTTDHKAIAAQLIHYFVHSKFAREILWSKGLGLAPPD